MKKSIYFYIFILSLFFLTNYTKSVDAQELGISDVVNIQLVPEIPKAGDNVYVYLTSYVTDINAASVTWKVDGKVIKSAIGEKIFNFTMGPDGQNTKLEIIIKTTDSGTISKNFILKPTSVDLIWESQGFVPPFYKGKSLFAHQNKVTIIAFPHILNSSGAELNPKNLIYKWKRNSSVLENLSGYGKNTLTIEGSIISRPVTISVEVSSDSGEAYGSITLEPTDPYVLLYKKDPTLGIQFQNALYRSVKLTNTNEITVIGYPFFFNKEDVEKRSLVNKWSINGKPVNNEKSQWIQTFRPSEGTTGSSNISLEVENPDRILQLSSKMFNLVFEKDKN